MRCGRSFHNSDDRWDSEVSHAQGTVSRPDDLVVYSDGPESYADPVVSRLEATLNYTNTLGNRGKGLTRRVDVTAASRARGSIAKIRDGERVFSGT